MQLIGMSGAFVGLLLPKRLYEILQLRWKTWRASCSCCKKVL